MTSGQGATTGAALPIRVAGTGEELALRPTRLIVAGYTGSDAAAVAAHIEELAAIGIPPPPTVPAFYDLDPALLTCEATVRVRGAQTSGEAEPVLIRHQGRHLLTVGSDHTDRAMERTGIAASKAACPKPVGRLAADLGADLAALPWESLSLESTVDGTPYQRGGAGGLRHPADTLARMTAALGEPEGDLVLFLGTLPLLTGSFVYGTRWRLRLGLPDGTRLEHAYEAVPGGPGRGEAGGPGDETHPARDGGGTTPTKETSR
ncbi:DUF2848 family protein [Streptomyces hoynatensis]|uniref:DUF2848 domain-containing protein n=1 Tax=Streptomyces hoynatensis TaxID=1141874 RepID=A0A3A9YL70_9ACTN|nr:DUF2848 family protein [Streptomyces hoynatensis]RKN37020.1 DUF2848 domain-containing protein [Streptomyces hoynatensis]